MAGLRSQVPSSIGCRAFLPLGQDRVQVWVRGLGLSLLVFMWHLGAGGRRHGAGAEGQACTNECKATSHVTLYASSEPRLNARELRSWRHGVPIHRTLTQSTLAPTSQGTQCRPSKSESSQEGHSPPLPFLDSAISVRIRILTGREYERQQVGITFALSLHFPVGLALGLALTQSLNQNT